MTLQELLQQAALVRDETTPDANTALRVGTVLIEAIVKLSEAGLLADVRMERTDDSIRLVSRHMDKDGHLVDGASLTIPAATTKGAGLLTPSGLAEIQTVIANMATPQVSWDSGSPEARQYVYSTGNNSQSDYTTVMAAGGTSLLQTGGRLVFRARFWNPEHVDRKYFTVSVPAATDSADGAMPREVFSRLGDGASIYEGASTATAVVVNYPNWASGNARTFTLSAATTAKAGVMTAADKAKLDAYPDAEALSFLVGGNALVEADGITLYGMTATGTSDYGVRIEAATQELAGVMAAKDKRLLAHILDLGEFASKNAACAYAARAEVAGNHSAALLVFTAPGATGKKLEGRIFQMVNGESVALQYLLWDKRVYRRDVTGATGIEGAATNAFAWEETGAHKLAYDTAARRLSILSYENGIVGSVVLPVVTGNAEGMMTASDKKSLDAIADAMLTKDFPSSSKLPFIADDGIDETDISTFFPFSGKSQTWRISGSGKLSNGNSGYINGTFSYIVSNEGSVIALLDYVALNSASFHVRRCRNGYISEGFLFWHFPWQKPTEM